jgi:hypothetical protein
VNLLSMLVRLQGTLGRTDLVNQMLLLPQAKSSSVHRDLNSDINLVVGYSHSPRSQTALDLTLWIAHQTRLATGKQVTVQVVYVIDEWTQRMSGLQTNHFHCDLNRQAVKERSGNGGTALVELQDSEVQSAQFGMAELFEQADRILWQARCLAEEWRGSLKTHLRFGSLTEELKAVVEAESASLLILGCESGNHPLVKQLGHTFPCPVLGIPPVLENE